MMWVFDAFADLFEKIKPIRRKKKMTDKTIPVVKIPAEMPLPPPLPVEQQQPATPTEPVTEPQKPVETLETAQKQEITVDEILVATYNEVIELRKDLNAFIRLNMK